MSSNHPESSSAHPIPPHQLVPTAQSLLQRVERDTGSPVTVLQVPRAAHPTDVRIRYAREDRPHTITLAEDAAPFWDYLVAHAAARALRFFAVPPQERVLAVVDRRRERQVARFLLPLVQKNWRRVVGAGAPPLPEASHLARLYHQGLVAQVVDVPTDLRIDTWLRAEYGDLRPLQETALRTAVGELDMRLVRAVRETTPPFVYRRAAPLNAAYSIYVARLLDDPSIATTYEQAGLGRIGRELADPLWETRFADYRQDCADTQRWAQRFGLVDWFAWQSFGSSKP